MLRATPRALALVLWGLDNIKTQGEGVAQALWLLGVRPVRDALGRVTEVEPRAPYDPLPTTGARGPEVGVGPWEGPWPTGPEYDEELLAHGDRRNVVDRYRY